MGRDLYEHIPEVAELYDRANEIVGYDLARLCFEGPAEKLDETRFSQPAMFVTSCACLKAMRLGKIEPEPGLSEVIPDACVGLSLGEYSALYASGAMGFEDGLILVQLRGESMQAAARQRQGAMVSILGLDENKVNQLCHTVLESSFEEDDGDKPLLEPVNYNCPGQIVLSGSVGACEHAVRRAQEFGAIKAIPLRVAGAFHTQMMAPAAEKLSQALNKCSFSKPKCKVVANVDAGVYDGPEEIKEKLQKQLVSAVRFQQSIELLLDQGADRFVEIGAGRVLTGLVKKISRAKNKKVNLINISGLS